MRQALPPPQSGAGQAAGAGGIFCPSLFRPNSAFTIVPSGSADLLPFNACGAKVAELGRGITGRTNIFWNGFSSSGAPVKSGTYIAVLKSGGQTSTRSFQLVR